jgi:hypothetical protein
MLQHDEVGPNIVAKGALAVRFTVPTFDYGSIGRRDDDQSIGIHGQPAEYGRGNIDAVVIKRIGVVCTLSTAVVEHVTGVNRVQVDKIGDAVNAGVTVGISAPDRELQ